MTLAFPNSEKNFLCDAEVDRVDLGPGNALVELVSGADVVLCSISLPAKPAFEAAGTNGNAGEARAIGGDAANPVSVGNPITGTGAVAAGAGSDVTSFRMKDSAGTLRWTGSVTLTGGGGDMTAASVTIKSGDAVSITSWVHKQP
jgi:hypothetical protein